MNFIFIPPLTEAALVHISVAVAAMTAAVNHAAAGSTVLAAANDPQFALRGPTGTRGCCPMLSAGSVIGVEEGKDRKLAVHLCRGSQEFVGEEVPLSR